ncbi:MAG: GNAT family N-acetyltransferase [Gemmatimonadales bacterium]
MPRITHRARSSVADELAIADYRSEDNQEALELDQLCVQGNAYRLSFRRSAFHTRATNYRRWRMLTARLDRRLVGTLGVALKSVTLGGEAVRAAFFFDLRVHPEYRRSGIARQLSDEGFRWASTRARLIYTYVVADNRVTQHLAGLFSGVTAGGYAYLVYPTYRPGRPCLRARVTNFSEVHNAFLAHAKPLDLYSNPACRPGREGYVASWIMRRGAETAGCSAWSNRGILGEVVERIPLGLQLAARCFGAWPLRRYAWPHIPDAGEELRSWYLFDFFATNGGLARQLMRSVEQDAGECGIDYCYIIHTRADPWISALRADIPRMFSPVVQYRLLAMTTDGSPLRLLRPYVDIRDL